MAHSFGMVLSSIRIIVDIERDSIMRLLRGRIRWHVTDPGEIGVANCFIECSGFRELEGYIDEKIGRRR